MTAPVDLSASVSLARAIEIATARIAACEAAGEVLDVSMVEALLRDVAKVWQGALGVLVAIQSDARYEQADDPQIVGSLRSMWMEMGQKSGAPLGHKLGGAEVYAMLAVEWADHANWAVQEAQRQGLRP